MSSEWPSEISISSKSKTLNLVWDGEHATISHKALRVSCRCSSCESLRRKLNDIIPVDPDVSLLKIEQLGSVGLQLFFSDQHERGIYPWTYLKQMAFGVEQSGFTETLMKGWHHE